MSMLLVADIHMDLSAENSYRWHLWKWLEVEIISKAINNLLILGDLTVAKDKHNSELVNRLVDALEFLSGDVNIYILMGNHDCCSEDTELFTKRGWINQTDIMISDQVVGINTNTGLGEWQSIQNVIRKNVSELWYSSGRGFDICCSKNHRVLNMWDGRYRYNTPSTIPICSEIINSVSLNPPENPDYSDDDIRLLAWILTDGSINNSGYITLYQSKHINEIDDLLRRLNLLPTRIIRDRAIKEICGKVVKSQLVSIEWHFLAEESKKILSYLKIIESHRIPDWLISLSQRQFDIFLNTVLLADGTVYNHKKWQAIIYKGEDFLSDMQGLLHINGYRSSLVYDTRGSCRLNICKRATSTKLPMKFTRTVLAEPVGVWCLTVPLGNFMVRRNGKVHITGNCIDPSNPFFGFTEIIEGVKFIVTPYQKIIDNKRCYFLPATKDYSKWEELNFADCDYIFTHCTYAGVKTESGFPLPGVDPNIFGRTNARIWSGDIHSPQDIPGTNISYVGAPYRTNYGDTYTPRVVYIDNDGGEHDLRFPCPSKHLVSISNGREFDRAFSEIPRGDFVKVRVRLPRADYPDWPRFKQEIIDGAKEVGWNLHGNPELVEVIKSQSAKTPTDSGHRSPEALVKAYSKRHKLDEETERFGLELLKEI